MNEAAYERYLDLLHTDGFAPWFSTVTPLAEVGLLPIGSRPAKRGLEPNRLTTCAPSRGCSRGRRRASTWLRGTAWARRANGG